MPDPADVLIERVGKADSRVLDCVAEDVFDAPISAAHLAAYLAQPNQLMCVAVHDGVVVGQARAVVHLRPDKPPELFIDNAGVAPAFQRRGIARRLLTEVIAWGRDRGCVEVWVGTELDNAPALALYRSLGLKPQQMVMLDGTL